MKPLVLETLFSPLYLARLERQDCLNRVKEAKARTNCVALHLAQREAKRATSNVIRLERAR